MNNLDFFTQYIISTKKELNDNIFSPHYIWIKIIADLAACTDWFRYRDRCMCAFLFYLFDRFGVVVWSPTWLLFFFACVFFLLVLNDPSCVEIASWCTDLLCITIPCPAAPQTDIIYGALCYVLLCAEMLSYCFLFSSKCSFDTSRTTFQLCRWRWVGIGCLLFSSCRDLRHFRCEPVSF